jgi:short-subunit dehydrogenase
MSSRKLSGAHVLLTGASSGIGRALAEQLLAAGAFVWATARREERLRELATVDQERFRYLAGDIADPEHRAQLLMAIANSWGRLDVLINNAGVGGIGPFAQTRESRLRRIMEVNFFAPVELIRGGLPLLRRGDHPLIVNMGSVLGHRAIPGKSEYCASKFALHGFSDALRAELAAEGIDLLLVSPSTTVTEFGDHVLDSPHPPRRNGWGAMSAEAVAARTLRAMRSGRHEVILSLPGKLLVWLDRLAPPLLNRILARWG